MKYLAMFMIDDMSARKFLEDFFQKNGQNVRLKFLAEAYNTRFGHNAALSLHTPEEWTEKKLDNIYVPVIVEFGKVRQLEAV